MHEITTLAAAAKHLESLAAELRDMSDTLTLPRQEYTITDAHAKLRLLLGPAAYIAIQPPEFHWHASGRASVDTWKVYDGKKHYEGAMLADAVNKCIEAHTEKAADTAENVEAVLAG